MYTRYFYLVLIGFALGGLVHGHMGQNTSVFGWSLVAFAAACVGLGRSPGPVNVWGLQRQMMAASGQRLPQVPTLTNESLLYVALVLEELGETVKVQLNAVANDLAERRAAFESGTMLAGADLDQELHLYWLEQLNGVLGPIVLTSRRLRGAVKAAPGMLTVSLTRDHAVAMLDGTADIMVTAAGLNESMGLPGEDGYAAAQTSNLSKRNPETGVIDKEPDGKWIKGRAFQSPTPMLERIIDDIYAAE